MAPIWPFTCKDQEIKHTFCRSKKSWCWLQTLQQATDSHISDYPCCILTSLNCASRHFVQIMLALNSQMCATSVTLSYFHVHTAINILRCFSYPREHNFGLVLILSPTGCTEGCVYFPQSCRNTHLPHFLDCLLNTTLISCLLCFLSLDTSRTSLRLQQSTKFGNRHTAHGRYEYSYTWLTHVRTGPKKKKIAAGRGARAGHETILHCSYRR